MNNQLDIARLEVFRGAKRKSSLIPSWPLPRFLVGSGVVVVTYTRGMAESNMTANARSKLASVAPVER